MSCQGYLKNNEPCENRANNRLEDGTPVCGIHAKVLCEYKYSNGDLCGHHAKCLVHKYFYCNKHSSEKGENRCEKSGCRNKASYKFEESNGNVLYLCGTHKNYKAGHTFIIKL